MLTSYQLSLCASTTGLFITLSVACHRKARSHQEVWDALAVVTVGPRGSGKSNFCEMAVSLNPALVLISRDKVIVELFGTTSLNPYAGEHEYASEKMWGFVKELLQSSHDITIILDAWNGSSQERVSINQRLRRLGADWIEAWYFVTHAEKVDEWFWKKPGIAKMGEMRSRRGEGLTFFSEDSPRRDYRLFHDLAAKISADGFDRIVRINPLTMGPEHVMKSRTSLPP